MARWEVPMSLRRAIIEADTGAMNVTELCRSHGVGTWFFWNVRRRYAAEGEDRHRAASVRGRQQRDVGKSDSGGDLGHVSSLRSCQCGM